MAVLLNKSRLSVAFILLILGGSPHNKLVQADSCDTQIVNLVSKCRQYVQWGGSNPNNVSKDCCAAVKATGIKCACDHVTKDLQKAIDMKKVVAVAAKCGRPIPPGTRCGSYRVPPA